MQLLFFLLDSNIFFVKLSTCHVYPHIDILAQPGAPVARLLLSPVLSWPGVAPRIDPSWPAPLGPRRAQRLAFPEGLQGFTVNSSVVAMPEPTSPGSQSSGPPPARLSGSRSPDSPRSRSPHQVASSPPVYEDETHQWCRNPNCPKKKKFKKGDTLYEAEKQHLIHSEPCRAYAPASVVNIIEDELQAMELWLQANPPEEREKPFICDVCNRAFEWAEALQQHKDTSEKCWKRAAEKEVEDFEQGKDNQWGTAKEDESVRADAGWSWHNQSGGWGSDSWRGGWRSDPWSGSWGSDRWSGAGSSQFWDGSKWAQAWSSGDGQLWVRLA